jgi:hypothetical protein
MSAVLAGRPARNVQVREEGPQDDGLAKVSLDHVTSACCEGGMHELTSEHAVMWIKCSRPWTSTRLSLLVCFQVEKWPILLCLTVNSSCNWLCLVATNIMHQHSHWQTLRYQDRHPIQHQRL